MPTINTADECGILCIKFWTMLPATISNATVAGMAFAKVFKSLRNIVVV